MADSVLGVVMVSIVLGCPKCGSSNLSKSGKRWAARAKKQQYLCGDCGHRTVNPVELQEWRSGSNTDGQERSCRLSTELTSVCAWCGTVMGVKDGEGQSGVTHGICPTCYDRLECHTGTLSGHRRPGQRR